MHLAALALLGLISTEHGQHSSQIQTRLRIPGDDPVREHLTMHVHSADSLINISEYANACQAFFGIPTGIQPLFFTACTPYTISCSSAKTCILQINRTGLVFLFSFKKRKLPSGSFLLHHYSLFITKKPSAFRHSLPFPRADPHLSVRSGRRPRSDGRWAGAGSAAQ